jgi:hypothetical protein
LRLDQLEQVQRDVAALLEGGLHPPASTNKIPTQTPEQIPAEQIPAENETASAN